MGTRPRARGRPKESSQGGAWETSRGTSAERRTKADRGGIKSARPRPPRPAWPQPRRSEAEQPGHLILKPVPQRPPPPTTTAPPPPPVVPPIGTSGAFTAIPPTVAQPDAGEDEDVFLATARKAAADVGGTIDNEEEAEDEEEAEEESPPALEQEESAEDPAAESEAGEEEGRTPRTGSPGGAPPQDEFNVAGLTPQQVEQQLYDLSEAEQQTPRGEALRARHLEQFQVEARARAAAAERGRGNPPTAEDIRRAEARGDSNGLEPHPARAPAGQTRAPNPRRAGNQLGESHDKASPEGLPQRDGGSHTVAPASPPSHAQQHEAPGGRQPDTLAVGPVPRDGRLAANATSRPGDLQGVHGGTGGGNEGAAPGGGKTAPGGKSKVGGKGKEGAGRNGFRNRQRGGGKASPNLDSQTHRSPAATSQAAATTPATQAPSPANYTVAASTAEAAAAATGGGHPTTLGASARPAPAEEKPTARQQLQASHSRIGAGRRRPVWPTTRPTRRASRPTPST